MRKKIYSVILIILVIISLKVNRVTFHFDVLYKGLAENTALHGFYEISDFYWDVAKTLNPNIQWYYFYRGRNKLDKASKLTEMTKQKAKLLDESLAYYEQELNEHPNDYATLCGIASVYKHKGDFDKAIEYLNLAYSQRSNDLWVVLELAYTYSQVKGDFEKGLVYIDEYLSKKPDDGSEYFLKAYTLSGLGRKKEAAEWYKKYLATNPDNRVAPLVNLSSIEIDLEDWENAEKHVDEGLRYNSTSSYLLSSKLDILIHKKQYNEAEELAQSFTRCKYLSYWALAEIEYIRGNKEKSENYFELSKQDAQEYFDEYCNGTPVNIYDRDASCRNRYEHINEFEKNKSKSINRLNAK